MHVCTIMCVLFGVRAGRGGPVIHNINVYRAQKGQFRVVMLQSNVLVREVCVFVEQKHTQHTIIADACLSS